MFEEYQKYKYGKRAYTLDDYDELRKTVDSRRKTMSAYVRDKLVNNNVIEQSNGESALMYFEKEISENALYILDEPENSLSATSQMKLAKFLEESARFYNCQFIISTHSPFLLSLVGAVIYNFDEENGKISKWSELENVKVYYDFFSKHKREFE